MKLRAKRERSGARPRSRLVLVPPTSAPRPTPSRLRLLAVGTGVGIEIAGNELRVLVARARPGGATVQATTVVSGFLSSHPSKWGFEIRVFLRQNGVSHLPSEVVLPRHEVTVRQADLPGVSDREVPNAVRLMLDSWHPDPDEVAYSWTRLRRRGPVLVAIIRRATLDRYISLFSDAGVKVRSFTTSANVLYSAIQMARTPPPDSFVTSVETGAGLAVNVDRFPDSRREKDLARL